MRRFYWNDNLIQIIIFLFLGGHTPPKMYSNLCCLFNFQKNYENYVFVTVVTLT